MSHRSAIITITAAAILDAIGGVAFAAIEHLPVSTGLYWAITTATTVGYGDVSPKTSAGRGIAVMVMLTCIPLFAATFSLFTSGLSAAHVYRAESRLKTHVRDSLHERLGDFHVRIDDLQEQFGNGFLHDLHERLDALETHLRDQDEQLRRD